MGVNISEQWQSVDRLQGEGVSWRALVRAAERNPSHAQAVLDAGEVPEANRTPSQQGVVFDARWITGKLERRQNNINRAHGHIHTSSGRMYR